MPPPDMVHQVLARQKIVDQFDAVLLSGDARTRCQRA